MKQQAIADFECGLLYILMRTVGWVAGLKGNDFLPTIFTELRAGVSRLSGY
jgi:hypothetical protein